MAKKIIVLAGSPLASDLDFDNHHSLPSTFEPKMSRYLGLDIDKVPSTEPKSFESTTLQPPKWRNLPLQPRKLYPSLPGQRDLSQNTQSQQPQFLSFTNDFHSQEQDEFLEFSLAVLESTPSPPSSLASSSSPSEEDETSLTEPFTVPTINDTTLSTSLTSESFSPQYTSTPTLGPTLNALPPPLLPTFTLKQPHTFPPLSQLPTPSTLLQLPSQNKFHLLVGIVTIHPPQPKLCRDGKTRHMVEMLVGDETRAGFSVKIWLKNLQKPIASHHTWTKRRRSGKIRSGGSMNEGEKLKVEVLAWRTGDVVCLRNVQLVVYKGQVYAQNSKRGVAMVVEKIGRKAGERVVFERNGGEVQVRALQERIRKVREWVEQFADIGMEERKRHPGVSNISVGGRPTKRVSLMGLPPDTQ